MLWGDTLAPVPSFDPLYIVLDAIETELEVVKMDIEDGDGSEYLQVCRMALERLRDRAENYHKLTLTIRGDEDD